MSYEVILRIVADKSEGEIDIMENNKLWQWFVSPPNDAPTSTVLLRLMAGGVFLWEGILKFVRYARSMRSL